MAERGEELGFPRGKFADKSPDGDECKYESQNLANVISILWLCVCVYARVYVCVRACVCVLKTGQKAFHISTC